MKFTKVAVLLLTLGLANAEELKKESNDGKYPEWKKAAEHAKAVAEAKHKSISELTAKLGETEKKTVETEVAKVKTELDKVVAAAAKVTALDKSDYEKAKEQKDKDAVAKKAAPLGTALVEAFLLFESEYKKAATVYQKQVAAKEGQFKILEFLKGKVANFEKDGFLTASILSALALSAVAVGSSFN